MKILIIGRKILFFAVVIAVALTYFSCRLSRPTSGTPRPLPIYSVDREDGAVAITFDCAWNADDIDDIIEVLGKYNCISTFFVVGDWAQKYPDAVKKLAEAGHEISNHSYNHAHYPRLSKEQMKEDMDRCDEIIQGLTGVKSPLFRPPYGDYNENVVKSCTETGRFCVQWDVDSLDWRDFTSGEIAQRVISKTKSGSIILLHNGTPNTYKALEQILPALSEKGFTFLPVSKLIYTEGFYIDDTGRQFKQN